MLASSEAQGGLRLLRGREPLEVLPVVPPLAPHWGMRYWI